LTAFFETLTGTQAKPGRAQHHAEQTNKYKDGISFNNKREKSSKLLELISGDELIQMY
jgi:hypothetical protein